MLVEAFQPLWRGGFASIPRRPNLALHSSITTTPDHHVITIPPFLPSDDNYPSALHKIHILPLLNAEESVQLLELAKEHAAANQSWEQQDSTRHISYNTVDFPTEESDVITDYLSDIDFADRVFGALGEAYDVDAEDMSFLDLFCASYEAATETVGDSAEGERGTMDRLEFHRDGSLLSFTVLLSSADDFEGGGTIFDALRDAPIDESNKSLLTSEGSIKAPQGYATLHSGKLLHGGHVVTKGQRIVLVGFVDVDERNVKPGVLGKAAGEWGRNDVRMFWNKRRLNLLKKQQETDGGNAVHPTWKSDAILAKEGRSCLGPGLTIPHFIIDRIESRADDTKIIRGRLRTEDELLREILLPRELRGRMSEGLLREVEYDENGIPIGIELGENDYDDEDGIEFQYEYDENELTSGIESKVFDMDDDELPLDIEIED